jgi:hypothetical protein
MAFAQPLPSSKSNKKKKKKSKARSGPGNPLASQTGVNGLDASDSETRSPPRASSRPSSPPTQTIPLPQTQADLLATANDLYRQIENAAASAIHGGAHAGAGGDEEYWSNLPAHLRSFIRCVSLSDGPMQ